MGCGFSHRNNDDPIVFPGEPGRSHNHTYIGNRSVDASATAASIRGGPTTCAAGADSSTYWVPTLYAGREPITPLVGLIYYSRRTSERVVPFPAGLKMVAGNDHARRPQSKAIVSWSCGGVKSVRRFAVLPACVGDRPLQLRVQFPNCWNGKTLDSPDHRRHMTYASGGRCPGSHPVAVPTLALILFYPGVPSYAQLSSGRYGGHADFINGWDQDMFTGLVSALN